ncbi:tyrosine-type recombinase/integrase [Anaerobacillus sp. CMMVII]|uniref:site-specific tyrosine recombinase/integron integrase n=1 Tax=Anaerobacillus sp. CMMVII TaxID=2755588 RepID=UPI0021B7CAA0|nr:site-specific tyrosine recombinase/integron integrase [Anaerobacillus sp. CMMVII]MCT8138653.1 tyrosine-type recombinase/integrase [Anaerobacillus sp. CMMVII]
MNNKTAGELLISEITGYISELVPIYVDEVKSNLSKIITKYHVLLPETDEIHPDLTDNIKLFLASKKLEGHSPRTLEGYQMELKKFAECVKKRTSEISAADIRVFLSQFEHLKMSTVGKKLSVLKSFFSWLAGEEIIQRDPTAKLKPPKTPKRAPKALSVEELEMLREACKTLRQRAFIEVMYATGCRLSEVSALNISDVNFQSMSFKVVGKGNKEREVFLSFKAKHHLEKYLKLRNDEDPALFVTERKPHRRLSNRGIQREIRVIADQSDVKKRVSPHVMRHTFATLTLNNGADIVAVQHLLGHTSPETTMTYAVLSEEKKREQHKKYLVM